MTVTGNDLVKLAREHVGEQYVFGIFVPKDNWKWKGPWDCAEFASWLVYQTANRLYGCMDNSHSPSIADAYTGYWVRDAKALGIRISIEQAARTRGAFVLRAPLDGITGHIVVSDGVGGTVEAHSTKRGVIQASLMQRRWDTGVLVSGVEYTEGPPVEVVGPKTLVYRMTTPPMKGPVVRDIQRALLDRGFDPGPTDGSYGALTRAAVLAFQTARGLLTDGDVGPKTAKALGITLPSPDERTLSARGGSRTHGRRKPKG
jgi:N-acetylmuramoyl-L-alanine amidase